MTSSDQQNADHTPERINADYTLDRIKADHKNARVGRDDLRAKLLGVLVGECETKKGTFNPARDLTAAEIIAEIKKLLDGVILTQSMINERLMGNCSPEDIMTRTSQIAVATRERTILERYLPKQMTEAEIENFVRAKITEGLNFGLVMRALKDAHPGRYDGQVAAGIVKAAMTG